MGIYGQNAIINSIIYFLNILISSEKIDVLEKKNEREAAIDNCS